MPEVVMCNKDKSTISVVFCLENMLCLVNTTVRRFKKNKKNVRLVQNLLQSPPNHSQVTEAEVNLPSVSLVYKISEAKVLLTGLKRIHCLINAEVSRSMGVFSQNNDKTQIP